ncbi:hypothetical protein [Microbacterium sp.]|uniref:hypothetical protein n=1 Tax=Microbacterium sp. TaxID=51671 RepID=UPI003A931CD8
MPRTRWCASCAPAAVGGRGAVRSARERLDRDAIEDASTSSSTVRISTTAPASLLVTSGSERRDRGASLWPVRSRSGIPRDVIDDALEDLPDDDAERALEFARSKASA